MAQQASRRSNAVVIFPRVSRIIELIKTYSPGLGIDSRGLRYLIGVQQRCHSFDDARVVSGSAVLCATHLSCAPTSGRAFLPGVSVSPHHPSAYTADHAHTLALIFFPAVPR